MSQRIVPSYVINHFADLVRLIESEEGGEKIWVPQQVENDNYHEHDGDEDQAKFKYKRVSTNGFYYLLHPSQTGPLSCEFILFSKDRDHQEDSGDTCFMRTLRGENGRSITLDQVLLNGGVMSGEVERYERYSAKIQRDAPQATEKPLGTTERNTLLTIIAALCKEAKLDHTKHAKSAGLIQSTAAGMGLSIGESTIEGHLKKIPNALASRMK